MISGVGHMSHVPCPFTEAIPMTIFPSYQALIGIHGCVSSRSKHVIRAGNAPDTWGRCAIHLSIPFEGTCLH